MQLLVNETQSHSSLTQHTNTGTWCPEWNMPHVVLGSAPDFVCSEITPMWNEEKRKICQRLASAFLRLRLYHLRCHVIFHMKRESRYRYSLARRLVLDEAFLPICYVEEYKDGILSNPIPKKSSYNFRMTRNLCDKTQNVSVNLSSRLVVTQCAYPSCSFVAVTRFSLSSSHCDITSTHTVRRGFWCQMPNKTAAFDLWLLPLYFSYHLLSSNRLPWHSYKRRRVESGTAARLTHSSIVTRWSLIWSFSSGRHGTQTDGFRGKYNGGFTNKPSWEVDQFKTSLYWKWAMFLCPAEHTSDAAPVQIRKKKVD